MNFAQLALDIKQWASELGFAQTGITDTDLANTGDRLKQWLAAGYHGEMDYMASHGSKRYTPEELIPGTTRVISVRMDYYPEQRDAGKQQLDTPEKAYVSRYTLGRDYHKTIRNRLKQLAQRIQEQVTDTQYRVFVDSAPVMERAIAEKAGLGWIGKNTMLISKHAGSYFFLAEIFTDIPLPIDAPDNQNHCGSCQACLKACSTDAFVGPYILDARRCISYLTIELKGSIPTEFRKAMGNRVFGCDDCQISCPWTKFTDNTQEQDFLPRHNLNTADLVELFLWTESEFLDRTAGSAIRRTGYIGWLRNLAVALGNAPSSEAVINALKARQTHPSEVVQEHTNWALEQHTA
ncbi:MAG: tRNA epoxyqueuosine(34) reductase QueG [Pseudomonadales bacterium]|nr:tRNA epoxyqueuosine(34) reductase QueG [Pseudomonadales bacterium]